MEYKIKLDSFEGPMDLLLHLLKKNKVEIIDIKISEITEQYLEYIDEMKKFDLNIASEFLLMASKLIELKVKTLLPDNNQKDEEDEEASKEELVQKLLEYKKYKELAAKLEEFERKERKCYSSNVEPILSDLELSEVNPLKNLNLDEFVSAFENVIKKRSNRKKKQEKKDNEKKDFFPRIQEKITVKTQQEYIRKKVAFFGGGLKFRDIFSGEISRLKIIVTFMALLELIKINELKIKQKGNFSEIEIYYTGGRNNHAQSI